MPSWNDLCIANHKKNQKDLPSLSICDIPETCDEQTKVGNDEDLWITPRYCD